MQACFSTWYSNGKHVSQLSVSVSVSMSVSVSLNESVKQTALSLSKLTYKKGLYCITLKTVLP